VSGKTATKLGGVLAAGLLSIFGSVGCTWPAPPPPLEDSRLLAMSPQLALDRARHWLHAQGFVIEQDRRGRAGGRVVASQSPFPDRGYARCAWAFAVAGGAKPSARVGVSATLARPGWTRLRTTVDISLVNGFGDRAECASQGKLEREILGAVAEAR
jgi:hypothetical protein